MTILQNLKDCFSSIFPLHLNATVQDLEDDLADADIEGFYQRCSVGLLKSEVSALRDTNKAYRKENTCLEEAIAGLRAHLKEAEKELSEVYSSMAPKLTSWPMPAKTHLEDTPVGPSILRLELPSLRLNMAVNRPIREGLYVRYTDTVADRIATAAYHEVKGAVLDTLKTILPTK